MPLPPPDSPSDRGRASVPGEIVVMVVGVADCVVTVLPSVVDVAVSVGVDAVVCIVVDLVAIDIVVVNR